MKKITKEECLKAVEVLKEDPDNREALQTIWDFGVQCGAIKTYTVRIG